MSSYEDRFHYHRHLAHIAQADVEFLKEKDRSYGASWKESGRSAWFMVKRMTDRLNAMMRRPDAPATFNVQNVDDTIKSIGEAHFITNVEGMGDRVAVPLPGTPEATVGIMRHLRDTYLSEDVLARMEAERLDGSDGTVTAVIRDLRRYCLLLEAEITERVSPDLYRDVSRLVGPDRGTTKSAFLAKSYGGGGSSMRAATVPAVDSNKHADRTDDRPWVIQVDDPLMNSKFYEVRERGMWQLRPGVDARNYLSDSLKSQYQEVGGYFILRIDLCPSHLRSRFPKLPHETNGKEREVVPAWALGLYEWIEDESKWRLLRTVPGLAAWTTR